MAFGDHWNLPSGHVGVELSRTRDYLRISRILPNWPWPAPPQEYVISLCSPADGVAVADEVMARLREVAA